MTNQALIALEYLTKTYLVGEQPLTVLNSINLAIKKGDYISIMGPSGSGKSTLLNMIGMLDRADTGHYWLNGQETLALDEEQRATLRRENIGFIFQNFHLIPRLTAFENVELPLVLAGVAPSVRKQRVMAMLENLGIADRASHQPQQLSGGQMQRVAIARALIMEPSVLLADEPTGNLDQASGHEVVELLESLNRKGITLIVVTHDKSLGIRAKRQLFMVDGVISQDVNDALL